MTDVINNTVDATEVDAIDTNEVVDVVPETTVDAGRSSWIADAGKTVGKGLLMGAATGLATGLLYMIGVRVGSAVIGKYENWKERRAAKKANKEAKEEETVVEE